MAIPASGQISFNLFNTDRGIASETQVNMATAGTAYGVSYTTNGSNPLGMDEFYGKSAGGSPTPPAPTPPTPPPFYSYGLNATPGEPDGASACAAWALGITTYYSAQSSITTGTSLYTTSAGIGNPTFAIPNGYRSNCTNYWNFSGGTTTYVGLLCGVTTYYIVDACDGSGSTTTSLAPPLTSQRYIDSVSGIYYYYTNMTTTSPSSISTTLQLVAGQTGCPASPPPSPSPSPAPSPSPSPSPSPTPSPSPSPSPSPTPTPPPPPPTPPYSYLLNNGGEATGPDACNEYNSFVRATYYSNQSSITTGTTLYLSDYVTTVPDGYYSNGTNYWYFGGGVTSDLGTLC